LAAVTVAAAAAAAFSTAEKGYVIVVQSAGISSIETLHSLQVAGPIRGSARRSRSLALNSVELEGSL
jgi:hypothetical protein